SWHDVLRKEDGDEVVEDPRAVEAEDLGLLPGGEEVVPGDIRIGGLDAEADVRGRLRQRGPGEEERQGDGGGGAHATPLARSPRAGQSAWALTLRAAAGAPPEVVRGGWPHGFVEAHDEVRARPVAPGLLERLERQDLKCARSSSSALGRRHATEQAPWQVGGVHVIAGSKGHPLHLPNVLRPRRSKARAARSGGTRLARLLDMRLITAAGL